MQHAAGDISLSTNQHTHTKAQIVVVYVPI